MRFPKLSKKQLVGLVSLLIILISLPIAIFLAQRRQIYEKKAVGPEARPTNVQIANLHGGGFSVSWTSVNPTTGAFQETTGSVFWGTDQNNLNQEAFDDRGQDISSTTHHISIFTLNPNTNYYLKIKSGPDLYGLNVGETQWVNGGIAKQQVTPITLDPTGNPHPIYGFIKKDGNTIAGALIYVQLKKNDSDTKSALMSTVTKTDEGWVADAKNARKSDLGSFFDFDDNDRVLLEVQAAQNGIASADFAINNSSPAPDITVTPPTTPTPTPTPTPTGTPTPIPTPTGTPTPTPTPEPGKAHLTFKVKFQGINQQRPNKTVKITLTKAGNIIAAFENEGVVSDENGIYTGKMMNVTPDTYDIYIKGWAHLQKKFSGIVLVVGENNQDWSGEMLRSGDAYNDNYVAGADFAILKSTYWGTGIADFNLDGEVNGGDFAIMKSNYFQCGDTAPGEQSKCH